MLKFFGHAPGNPSLTRQVTVVCLDGVQYYRVKDVQKQLNGPRSNHWVGDVRSIEKLGKLVEVASLEESR